MPVARTSIRPHRRARLLIALLGLLLLLPATPAAAHAVLVKASPAAFETVTKVPAEVVLTFNESLAPGLSTIVVADGTGGSVTVGSPVIAGNSVVQTLRPDLAAGGYVVRYKVISADGHPVSDAYSFTIPDSVAGGGGTASQTSSPASETSTTGTTSATETTSTAATASQTGTAAGAATNPPRSSRIDVTDSSRSWATAVLWAGLALVLIATAIFFALLSRGRRRASSAPR